MLYTEHTMKRKWTVEKLQKEALKYKTRGEFFDSSGGAYNAAIKLNTLDQICSHMPKHVSMKGKDNPSFKWTEEMLQQEALKYSTRGEFAKNSPSAYQICYKKHILDKICQHMKKIRKKWTLQTVKLEALKYHIKKEFQKNSGSAYNIAIKYKILDEICSHMVANKRWTHEELQKEALKHDTRNNFNKNSNSAYITATKRNILDEICQHMKKSKNSSFSENLLFEEIVKIYPKTQKLRIRNKKIILTKPYIKGFDIDIYVPELRKGIEFDGKYWHSKEGLLRSRADWPLEDIINYHQIKDDYFLSKGIQILHINENDWNKDKENCINKCLNFLKY